MSTIELESLPQLARDVRKLSATLDREEARGLVYLYYGLQDFRIKAGGQNLALTKRDEPHETIAFFHQQFYQLEKDIAKALDTYSAAQVMGEWARLHVGVGPVIAAGLLAHIDITRTPSPSALWKFAGLTPGQRYVKGEKRSWNADLKLLCWKLSDSFVKQSGRENCYYGHLYLQRKAYEVARNEAVQQHPWDGDLPDGGVVIGNRCFVGGNAAAALRELQTKKIQDKELRALLESGRLAASQLDKRARRWAVKRFLAHYWQAAHWAHYGTEPPRAYVFEHMGHVHEDPCPVPFPKPRPT